MSKKFEIIKNSLLSITALLVFNGVQQFLLYPYLTKQVGVSEFGNILVILGVIAIFAPATGLSVNNTRIVAQNKYTTTNGDANITLSILIIPGIIVASYFFQEFFDDFSSFVLSAFLIFFTALRNYSDIEYRLSLNYNRYFIYYSVIPFGYVLGIILYRIIDSWLLVLILGEIFGFSYVAFTGSIYRSPFKTSSNFKLFFKDCFILFLSYLLYNGVLNLDRVLLKYLLSSEIVTIFYVSSLMGKMIAMLVGPLNSIAISYLCKQEEPMNRKLFSLLVSGALAIGLIFYIACYIITPIFAYIAYPDIYQQVIKYSPLANLSQIVCFIGSFLLTVVLTFSSNRWQIVIQSIYAITFLILSTTLCIMYGYIGFLYGILAANVLRLLLTIMIGTSAIKKKGKTS